MSSAERMRFCSFWHLWVVTRFLHDQPVQGQDQEPEQNRVEQPGIESCSSLSKVIDPQEGLGEQLPAGCKELSHHRHLVSSWRCFENNHRDTDHGTEKNGERLSALGVSVVNRIAAAMESRATANVGQVSIPAGRAGPPSPLVGEGAGGWGVAPCLRGEPVEWRP